MKILFLTTLFMVSNLAFATTLSSFKCEGSGYDLQIDIELTERWLPSHQPGVPASLFLRTVVNINGSQYRAPTPVIVHSNGRIYTRTTLPSTLFSIAIENNYTSLLQSRSETNDSFSLKMTGENLGQHEVADHFWINQELNIMEYWVDGKVLLSCSAL